MTAVGAEERRAAPTDDGLYDRLAGSWWDGKGVLNLLETAINPVRFEFFRSVLEGRQGFAADGSRGLDVGCGGGILTEAFAGLGCRMTGVDPSRASIGAARAHAAARGLAIDYGVAVGEAIPFPDGRFDFVCCCDVLEHVADMGRVVAEAARVLRPGGLFFYDTLNRTWRSNLVAIRFAQQWRWSRFLPPDVHRWPHFIRPAELRAEMSRRGIRHRETRGMSPGVNPLRVVLLTLRLKRGRLGYGEFGAAIRFRVSRDPSVAYLGYGERVPAGG